MDGPRTIVHRAGGGVYNDVFPINPPRNKQISVNSGCLCSIVMQFDSDLLFQQGSLLARLFFEYHETTSPFVQASTRDNKVGTFM